MHRNGGFEGICVGSIGCASEKKRTESKNDNERRATRVLVTNFESEL